MSISRSCFPAFLAIAAFLAPASLVAQEATADSAAVVGVIDAYHRALATADTAAVLRLLAPDAIILESGGEETVDEYVHHHLPADMAFAAAVPRERGPVRVRVKGDTAWASSISTAIGEFRDRSIRAQGAELMVLARDGDVWRIRAIHWSSRTLRQ
jgi:ketosteroid isomerase-like protein